MKILIIGGYGNFGKRLVASLLNYYDHEVIVAGRSEQKAIAFKQYVFGKFAKQIDYVVIDVLKTDLNALFEYLRPEIVVNASGPYQLQNNVQGSYRVARACIKVSCHYVDLADDRVFVNDFSKTLNREAKAAGVMLVSGASSVPGLTSAVIDEFMPEFSRLETIRYGISPGNKTERGEATVGSILSYTGKPFTTLINGCRQSIYGWQGLRLYDFGFPLGKRWMGNCNIPDLELLPSRYPELKTVHFQAGLEMTLLHIGLWCLSWPGRFGWVKNWTRYSKPLTGMSEWFIEWGSDNGGMYVELEGQNLDGASHRIAWQLVAENGVGINVPTISAELVIERISEGDLIVGAMPCVGLFNLSSFFAIADRWGIYQRRIDK
jgi:hypothetical protein